MKFLLGPSLGHETRGIRTILRIGKCPVYAHSRDFFVWLQLVTQVHISSSLLNNSFLHLLLRRRNVIPELIMRGSLFSIL